jgi:hypothetical protein
MVVSSLLMIVAAGILGTFLVSWSNSSFTLQKAAIANQTAGRINLINEEFIVEDVWFYTKLGTNYANVTMRNTGDLAIKVSSIYVNNSKVWSGSQVIPMNTVDKVTIQTNWGSNKQQSIWIQTSRGAEVKQVWKS